MSVELGILRLFCDDIKHYKEYHVYINSIKNLEREISYLFQLVEMYYTAYETPAITEDELVNCFNLNMPNAKEKELYYELIHTAFQMDVNEDLMKDLLDQLIEKHYATSIINKLIPTMEGSQYGTLHDIRSDIDEYINLLNNPPEEMKVPEPCEMSVEELIEQEILDEGLPWHLGPLTDIIGGVRAHTLGLIYAYVDSGKTSFALAAAAHQAKLLSETDSIIAYAGNEEKAPRLLLRFMQFSLGKTRTQMVAMGGDATEQLKKNGLDRVKIFDDILTGDQIVHILEEYNPYILFVDQATDVDVKLTRKAEGIDYLKALFKWYRRLANKHDCAIIGVSQGVGEAENKKWLKLSDIYGSRVAIQGALDYGIGIGRRVDDPAKADLRYINIPKNKLHDGAGGKFVVHFTRDTCLWRIV
jgi:hypothetical protein